MADEFELAEENAALHEQNDKLAAELATFGDKYSALQAKYEALQLDHNQMIAALPPAVRKSLSKKSDYVYGDNECRPVVRGQTCTNCGWSADKSNPKHTEVHPIA